MPQIAKELTVKEIEKKLKNLKKKDGTPAKDGAIAIGGVKGLYACKRNGNFSFWMLKDRKEPSKSIYYAKEYTLAEVRDKARLDLIKKKEGRDPKAERQALIEAQRNQEQLDRQKKLEESFTFRVVTDAWIQHKRPTCKWKDSPRNERRERKRIEKDIFPAIGDRPISTITSQEMAKLFNKLYLEKHETARKLLPHVRGIFAYASSSGEFGTVPDPFDRDFEELTKGARKRKEAVRNHPALPFAEVPDFMKALLENGDNASLAIAFSLLTATRNQAVILADWREIDFAERKWVVPQEHDKAGAMEETYRTAFLSKQAIEFLNLLPSKQDGEKLFPPNPSRPCDAMDDGAFSRRIKRMHEAKKSVDNKGWIDPKIIDEKTGEPSMITQHGTARASFSTWAEDDVSGNAIRFDERAVDFCIFHKRPDPYKKGYKRHEMEAMRREIMQAWADYCLQGINLEDYFPKQKR